jgi:uncharacterized protein YlbG (UPF0298 family)
MYDRKKIYVNMNNVESIVGRLGNVRFLEVIVDNSSFIGKDK